MAEGNNLSLVATDGHRLAFANATLDVAMPSKQEVILPRKTVLELQRLLSDKEGAIEMQFAGNQAKFSFDGMEFVTKLVEGKFPDYNRVIPRNHTNELILGRQTLLSSLQRTAIMTSDKFKGVRLNIEPGSLRIAASNAEQEEATDEIEIEYSSDAIDIGFNVTYLMDVLANMSQDMVRISLSDGNSSALITCQIAKISSTSSCPCAFKSRLGASARHLRWRHRKCSGCLSAANNTATARVMQRKYFV